MKRFFCVLVAFFLCLSTGYAATVTLDPVDTSIEYIYPEPNGYNQASVTVEYELVDDNLKAHIQASGLKPWFTYQVKLTGTPSCIGGDDETNEKIGYSGRWYCVDCDSSPAGNNRSDAQYEANKALPDDHPDKECIVGYLVFDYFVTDETGAASLDVETNASYHVLWCGPSSGSNAYLYSGYTPETSYCDDGKYCAADDVVPEIERSAFSNLPNGVYTNVKLSLTEESFHQNCGTWSTVLEGSLSFEIEGDSDDSDGDGCSDSIDAFPYAYSFDSDGDGYAADCDCDDSNPYTNPGAIEIPFNLTDDNCDGQVCFIATTADESKMSGNAIFFTFLFGFGLAGFVGLRSKF